MDTADDPSRPTPGADPTAILGPERTRAWARRLGRLRLGVEPLADQLARHRRATWALTAVASGVAVLFLGLFTGFGRPDVGLVLVTVLIGPVVGFAWIGLARSRRLVARFEAEVAARGPEPIPSESAQSS